MTNLKDFLKEWQTLIGAALGPFLAVILSAIGFWCRAKLQDKKERRESLRRIEVGITKSLNDTYNLRRDLKSISKAITILASEARVANNDKFFLDRINFPTISDIYRDPRAANFKVRSYYLHNNLNFIDGSVKQINKTNADLKNDFVEMIRLNELIATLAKDKSESSIQRKTYADNLENFARTLDTYVLQQLSEIIKKMTYLKIYNDHLRQPLGYWFWWKHEGTNLKYFKNKFEYEKFAKNLNSLTRIDLVIKEEVEKSISDAEKRLTNAGLQS